MDLKNKTVMQKIQKWAGITLIACGAFGFFYVMYSGSAAPKDVMITIFFFAMGVYSLKMSGTKIKLK